MAEIELTWQQFERAVKETLSKCGANLDTFEVQHDESIERLDGTYQVDVSVRFELFDGASFLVLVECKHWKNRVKREQVQVLRDRLQSTGAQKGMLFSTGGFQSGAIQYAQMHGIALVHVTNSGMEYMAKARNLPPHVPTGPVPRFTLCSDEESKPFDAGESPASLKSYVFA